MALAARELREPLSNILITASNLYPLALQQEDPNARDQASRMNRGLIQMMRILNNMADANRYARISRQEILDIDKELADRLPERFNLTISGKDFSLYGRKSGRHAVSFEIAAK